MLLTVLTILAIVTLVLCAAFGWTFVALFSRVRWWETPEGRHLMRFTVELSLVFSLTLLDQVLHMKPETAAALSIALFGAIAYDLLMRVRLQIRAYREARPE